MSYTLAYTGTQIDNILGRSAPNGEFDGYFADINDKLDKLNIVTTSDDYATVQAYVQNNVAVALSDGGKFYVYTGEYDGNYYFACVTQGSSDTTDAVFEVAYIDSGNNWSVGNGSVLAPIFSPNFTGNPTAPTPTQSSNNTKIATTAFVHSAVDPVSSAALNAYPTDTVSGDVVSITDGADSIPVKAFTGSIVPVQDLNGQSAPYPAGGGANKVDQTTLTNTGVVSDTGATGTQTTRLFSALFPVTPSTTYYAGVDGKSSNNETIQFNRFIWFDSSKNFISRSSTGQSTTGVNITTPANAYYASIDLRTPALTTNLVAANVTKLWFAVGSGTVAYSPYSNICPISGWAQAELYRTGINLCNPATITDGYRVSNNGNLIVGATAAVTDYIPIKGNTSYYLRNTLGASSFYSSAVYDANKTFIGNLSVLGSGASSGAITTPANARFIRVNMPLANKADFSFNYPSTVTTYEAYQGDTILLDFGQTVYAGTITALGGGKWSIQPTHAIVDLGTLSYNYRSAKNCFDATVTGMVDGVAGVVADIKCSTYPAVASLAYSNWQNAQDKSIFASSSESSKIVIRDTAYTSAADFVAAVTGQTLLYPLATLPDPIIVSAEDLQTLLGANTVWTDVGSVTGMTYRADTSLYIDKKLGA